MKNTQELFEKKSKNTLIRIFLSSFFLQSKINTKVNSSELPSRDYLYKKNKAEYLLGPGDSLKISISRSIP